MKIAFIAVILYTVFILVPLFSSRDLNFQELHIFERNCYENFILKGYASSPDKKEQNAIRRIITNLLRRIEERYGIEECFLARESAHDVSFLRQYLTEEDAQDLGLFSFARQRDKYKITDISDEEGWKSVKQDLLKNIGTNPIPVIYVNEVMDDNTLTLVHDHDGRDLELQHADEVVLHISRLWGDVIKLFTVVEGDTWEI